MKSLIGWALLTTSVAFGADTCSVLDAFHAASPLLARASHRSPEPVAPSELGRTIASGRVGDYVVEKDGVRVEFYLDKIEGDFIVGIVGLGRNGAAPGLRATGNGFALLRVVREIVEASARYVESQPAEGRPVRVILRADQVEHPELREILRRLGMEPEPSPLDNVFVAQLRRFLKLVDVPRTAHALGQLRTDAGNSTWGNLRYALQRAWDSPDVRSYRLPVTIPPIP